MGISLLWAASVFSQPPRAQAGTESTPEIIVQTKEYRGGKGVEDNGQRIYEGRIFRPTARDQLQNKLSPGILLVHNWMGVSAETEKQAKRYAELGYVVFAADIYGKGVRPANPQEAATTASLYKNDRKLFRERLSLALEVLKELPGVDPKRLAVLGYCFGGTGALELARSGAELRGTVSFHGGLDSLTPSDGAKIKGEVLVHHGGADPFVRKEDLDAFKVEMNSNKVRLKFYAYPKAVHSFTDVNAGSDLSKGQAYNADADQKSYSRTRDFLARVFK